MKKLLIFMVLSLLLVSCGKNENPDVVSDNKENQEVSMNSENIDKKIIEEKIEEVVNKEENQEVSMNSENIDEEVVDEINEEDDIIVEKGNEIIEDERKSNDNFIDFGKVILPYQFTLLKKKLLNEQQKSRLS